MIFETVFLLLGAVQVFGFFVEGAAGFGCTIISAPFATSILGISEGVPFGTMMSLPLTATLAFHGRKNISWKDLGKILLACLPGLFFGQYFFNVMNPDHAKMAIGIVVILIAIYKLITEVMLKGERGEDTTGKKIFRYACLVAGGIVHGAFSIGGPLITVYTLESVKDRITYRNTMACLWTTLNIFNVTNQVIHGSLSLHLISVLFVCYPFAICGYISGNKFLKKINREQFLKFVYIVLLFVGIVTFVRSVMA